MAIHSSHEFFKRRAQTLSSDVTNNVDDMILEVFLLVVTNLKYHEY